MTEIWMDLKGYNGKYQAVIKVECGVVTGTGYSNLR